MSRRKGIRQCHDHECTDPSTSTLTDVGPSSPPSPTTTNPEGYSSISTAILSTTVTSTSPSVTDSESPSTSTAPKSTNIAAVSSSSPDAGTIAGSVIGGVIFLVLVILGLLLYLRARKKKRTPPSSEFINSIRDGAAPVLRLESGAEYTPALAEKGGGYTHYSPSVPLPFMQNSYYTSPPMQDMKFPDESMEVPSGRPSVDKPLQPQRYSSQQQANDSFVSRHHPGTSVGSRRELWGSDTEVASSEFLRQSPAHRDTVLQFAPRFSLDDPSSHPLHASYSPPSLHPLRRQPDPDGT
ncbi:hypothetical protein V8E55_011365 [Tylopilus felleus]